MINNFTRGLVYFVVFVAIQILVLNNVHFLRIATPFLYIFFILKIPVGTSRITILLLSFFTGIVIDSFSNTPGMHAAACTLAGFAREPIIQFFMGKDLAEDIFPSYKSFGVGGFARYVISFVSIHHITLYIIESLALFDPLFLSIRILTSIIMTTILILAIEAFNLEIQKNVE